jgi:transketolase
VRNAFASKLLELASKDPRIILITGDLGYGVLDEFRRQLPRQFINAGIAEQSMMTMAAGLASQGFRPFVYSIANFPTFRCLEQIRNDVSYMENPVTIVSVGSGLSYGAHGYTHHAVEDISIMRIFSNIDIYTPMDVEEVKKSLDQILLKKSPAYLRLGKGGEGVFTEKNNNLDFNLINEGKDGVVCWVGAIGEIALEGRRLLLRENLEISTVSMFAPSDESIANLLKANFRKPILTLEEHILRGGFGSWVLEVANEINFQGRISSMAIDPNNHSTLGSQSYLREKSGLTSSNLTKRFIKLCEE